MKRTGNQIKDNGKTIGKFLAEINNQDKDLIILKYNSFDELKIALTDIIQAGTLTDLDNKIRVAVRVLQRIDEKIIEIKK